MKIQAIGATSKTDDGVILVMPKGDMPSDCVVIFVKLEDSKRLIELFEREK